jgi:AraC family transcriptional regulator of adaptative response/methylated-DNA-[protein]-cysteine methyltransferase
MTVMTMTRGAVAWRERGDAFVARRLRELLDPGETAGVKAAFRGASLAVVATRDGIARIDLTDSRDALLPLGVREERGLRDLAQAIARALESWAPEPESMPIDVSGTPFQVAVWRALRAIPAGRTRTYGEVAEMVGSPGGARAVGGAVGSNPIPILVPCHRVVASGGIGGFGCGLPLKRRLLAAEGVIA